MPIYEFCCQGCGERFEELVGSHVGTGEADVRCPACGSASVERQLASSYAPTPRLQTPNQKRRSEAARDTSGGGAMRRFRKQRAAERRAARKP